MGWSLVFGALVATSVLIAFVALWRMLRAQDPIEARLKEYGVSASLVGSDEADVVAGGRRPAWPTVTRILAGFGFGPRLAEALERADLPLTAAEYALIVLGAAILGGVLGTLRAGPIVGLALALIVGYVPILYLQMGQRRRLRAFTAQLPDVLTLLVGALRAGYGLSQAMEMLTRQMPPPASKEFTRVMRSVELGLPVQEALRNMSDRVGSDDLALVVTAVNVQYEMGGNLAQTLETIGETVRDRIRMLQEIRVLTAQQRFTGYFLAVWPVLIAVGLFLLNPQYMRPLMKPPWIILPAVALVMQVLGYLVIRRIVDIEV